MNLSNKFSMMELRNELKGGFPTLCPLKEHEVNSLQNHLNQNKGITNDGYSDTWLKNTTRRDLICNWWNPTSLKLLGEGIFRARLIPLNKVYPKIPDPS